MTLEQIKEELATMPEAVQDHLLGYLIHLRNLRDPTVKHEFSKKIDDRDPSHWVSLDQLRERWKGE